MALLGLIVAFTGDAINALLIVLLTACEMTSEGGKFAPPA